MAKVFIPTTAGSNAKSAVEGASQFGTPVGVLHRDAFPDDHATRIEKMRVIIDGVLGSQYNPEEDFIMLFGDPIAQALIFMWLQDRCSGSPHNTMWHKFYYYSDGTIRCLKWDRSEQCYYQVRVPLIRGDASGKTGKASADLR